MPLRARGERLGVGILIILSAVLLGVTAIQSAGEAPGFFVQALLLNHERVGVRAANAPLAAYLLLAVAACIAIFRR